MNAFDATILGWVNDVGGSYPRFDRIVEWIARENMVKGGVVAAVLCGLWFVRDHKSPALRRQYLIAAVASGLVAEFVARAMALTLPFRPRPMHAGDPGFKLLGGIDATVLEGWSSFPSDHATLFFALAAGAWFCSRPVGLALLAYTAVVICLPRIYMGLHYPTDILAGAVIGVLTAFVVQQRPLREWLARPLLKWEQRSPSTFYAAAVFFTLQYALLFAGLRNAVRLVRDLVGL